MIYQGAKKIIAPVRIYGDDVEEYKGQKCLVLNLYGCATMKKLSTWLTRFLITLVPDDVTPESMELVYAWYVGTWRYCALALSRHKILLAMIGRTHRGEAGLFRSSPQHLMHLARLPI